MQSKFFSSKLNTALLLILIILMIIALRWMYQDKTKYFPVPQDSLNEKDLEFFDNISVPTPNLNEMMGADGSLLGNSWAKSPSDFGTVILYPLDWQITPQYYASAAMQARGEESLVGYGFMLPSTAIVTWGGAQGGCSEGEFGRFIYGVSNLTCMKGYRTSIGMQSARSVLSTKDLNLFGDFVLKNK